MFMFLESLHVYSIVAFVVKKNGMLTKNQNLMLGWGVPIAIVFVRTAWTADSKHFFTNVQAPKAYYF